MTDFELIQIILSVLSLMTSTITALATVVGTMKRK